MRRIGGHFFELDKPVAQICRGPLITLLGDASSVELPRDTAPVG